MKNPLVAVGSLLIIAALAHCKSNTPDIKPALPPKDCAEVLPNVYDNNREIAYFKVENPAPSKNDESLAEIEFNVNRWQKLFPSKKVSISSLVHEQTDRNSQLMLVGLLMIYHYTGTE